MNEVRSVRISVSIRDQLKVLARELSTRQKRRVTIAGLLEEGIDELAQTPLDDLMRWAKEKRSLVGLGEESTPIGIDAARAEMIGILAATIQERSQVSMTILDLMEEVGRRSINRFKETSSSIPSGPDQEQPLREKKVSIEMNKNSNNVSRENGEDGTNKVMQDLVTPATVVIMVYNRKGGVGKTSISGNLAANLAALGFNVAIIDGDDQTNISRLDKYKKAPASLTNVIMETSMGGNGLSTGSSPQRNGANTKTSLAGNIERDFTGRGRSYWEAGPA